MKSCRSFWAFHILKFPYCIVTVWNLDAWRTVWPAMKFQLQQSHGATRFCVIAVYFSWTVSKNGYIFISFASIMTPDEAVAGSCCWCRSHLRHFSALLCPVFALYSPCTRVQSCSFLFRTARLTWTFEIAWMMLISCFVKNRQVMLKEEDALYSSSSRLSSFSDSLE